MKAPIPIANARSVRALAVLLLLAGGLLLATIALCPVQNTAQARSPQSRGEAPLRLYDLSWHTVDGGGHTWSSGGSYTLGGTMGQPDAGSMAGGTYSLGGGFWEGGALAAVLYNIYLPLSLK